MVLLSFEYHKRKKRKKRKEKEKKNTFFFALVPVAKCIYLIEGCE